MDRRRVGLVGCVKQKVPNAVAAQDLYVSTLFVGRRRYVERSCDEWWILSALHGLVHPEDVLEPYDLALNVLARSQRREWSKAVLAAIDDRIAVRPGDVVELHAGAEYRDFGLSEGLRQRGADIVNPTSGLGIGKQLAFYRRGAG